MSSINRKIFKAYDVRGKYPSEINEAAVEEISRAVAGHFGKRAKIVVGHDARLSSPFLYKSVLKGIMNNESRIKSGRKKPIIHNSKFIIHSAGLITTPMLYFLVNELNADGGIMVTASHNPKEYNGLKIVGKNAEPISGLEIRKLVEKFSS